MMSHFVLKIGAVLGLVTTAAWSQQSSEAAVTIGEVEYAFALNAEQSDWSGSANFPSISIALAAGDEAREHGFFSLRFGFEMGGGQIRGAEAKLLRRSGDATESLYCEDETESGGLLVEVESAVQNGDSLSIEGRISCLLGTSENYGRDIDLSDPLDVSANYTLVLKKL